MSSWNSVYLFAICQCFPTFLTCYPKLHPDVGRYPPVTQKEQYFIRSNAPLLWGAHLIKREQMKNYNH